MNTRTLWPIPAALAIGLLLAGDAGFCQEAGTSRWTREERASIREFVVAMSQEGLAADGFEAALPALRHYALHDPLSDEQRRDALWVLARLEFESLKWLSGLRAQAADDVARQAAAWRVIHAGNEFVSKARETVPDLAEPWGLRVVLARSWIDTAYQLSSGVGEPLTRQEAVELAVSGVIEVFAPTSDSAARRGAYSGLREMLRASLLASHRAIDARLRAARSLRDVYGISPEATRKAVEDDLHPAEVGAFFAPAGGFQRLDGLIAALRPEDSAPPPADGTSILESYRDLRRDLGLDDGDLPPDDGGKLEELYRNTARRQLMLWALEKARGTVTGGNGARPGDELSAAIADVLRASHLCWDLAGCPSETPSATHRDLLDGVRERLLSRPDDPVTGARERDAIDRILAALPALEGLDEDWEPPQDPALGGALLALFDAELLKRVHGFGSKTYSNQGLADRSPQSPEEALAEALEQLWRRLPSESPTGGGPR